MAWHETWHDSDAICLRRLRADGFQVLDRPRPRLRDDTLATNHGGLAVVAAEGLCMSPVDLGCRPSTFELLCVRVASASSVCIVATVYHPGSADVTSTLFCDLADLLDRLATYVEPVYLVGDINIRLERAADSDTARFANLIAAQC